MRRSIARDENDIALDSGLRRKTGMGGHRIFGD